MTNPQTALTIANTLIALLALGVSIAAYHTATRP